MKLNSHARFRMLLQRHAQSSATRDTNTVVSTRRPLDMKDKILLLEPDKAPLVVLTGRLKKKKAIDPKVQWHTDTLIGRWTQANGGETDSATTIDVDSSDHITVNDILRVTATGEQLLVTAVGSSTQITVTRGYGETSAAAIADNAYLVVTGSANQEGSAANNMNQKAEVGQFNYAQIFRTTFGITGTEDATQLFGGRDRNYLRMKKGIEHAIKMEMAFWFSERKEDTSGTHPRRTLRGVDKWLTTNRTDASGTLTEAELEQFCESAFRYGNTSEKWAFCSARVISVINQFAAGKLQQVPTDKTFGIHVTKYLSGHGQLNLVKHHLFENDYNERMYVLDIDDLMMRPLRDTRLRRDIQDNDDDEIKDEYLTEVSLELGNESKHALLYNVTG